MNVIKTDTSTPPPLLLMLQLMKSLTTTDTSVTPLNVGYGTTNVVETSGLGTAFSNMKAQAQTNLLTLAGQMLWRYLPALVPEAVDIVAAAGAGVATLLLDTKGTHQYLRDKGLAEILPDGSHFTSLKQLFSRRGKAVQVDQRAKKVAQIQRNARDIIPRLRARRAVRDMAYLGSYTVVRDNRGFTSSPQTAITLDAAHAYADKETRINDTARRTINFSRRIMNLPLGRPGTPLPKTSNMQDWKDVVTFNSDPVTTPLAFLTGLKYTRDYIAGDTVCDHDNPFKMNGALKNGTFYNTPMFNVKLAPLNGELFGFVDLDTRPFEITLNSNMAYPRVQMSLAHEMIHVLTEMHKINLPHETVHELALLMVNDIMPGLSRLAEWTNRTLT